MAAAAFMKSLKITVTWYLCVCARVLTSVCRLRVFFFAIFKPPALRSLQKNGDTHIIAQRHVTTCMKWPSGRATVSRRTFHGCDLSSGEKKRCRNTQARALGKWKGYRPAVTAPFVLFLQVGGGAGARGTGARGHVASQDGG